MKLKTTISAVALAAMGITGFAAAGFSQVENARQAHPGVAFVFEKLDTDGDGRITAEEIQAFRTARIAGLDADGDNFLTAAEIAAFQLAQARERIEARVERLIEARAAAEERAGTAREAIEEIVTAARAAAAEMVALELAGVQERIDARSQRLMTAHDLDGDGKLSVAEGAGALLGLAGHGDTLMRFDADGDGVVTREEFTAGLQGARGGFHGKKGGRAGCDAAHGGPGHHGGGHGKRPQAAPQAQ